MVNVTGYFTCDNCYAVYLGNSLGVTQKLLPTAAGDWGEVNTQASQIFNGETVPTFQANSGDWLYIITWSDASAMQGLIGSFVGNSIINTGDPGWEVAPADRRVNPYADPTQHPTMTELNTVIPGLTWGAPALGPDNLNTRHIYGGGLNQQIGIFNTPGTNPTWVWYDSGNDTSGATYPTDKNVPPQDGGNNSVPIPFKGFNHDEFLVFRFPISIIERTPCEIEKEEAKEELEEIVEDKHFTIKDDQKCPDFGGSTNPNEPGSQPCSTIEIPNLKPCFYLHWGDGPKDQIETEDFELAILSICNPFDNVKFKCLTLTDIEIVHADGSPIEKLPDGSPAAMLVPSKRIELCSLDPCSCTHVELAIRTCGTIPGDYLIRFNYCIDEICMLTTEQGSADFEIELVSS